VDIEEEEGRLVTDRGPLYGSSSRCDTERLLNPMKLACDLTSVRSPAL